MGIALRLFQSVMAFGLHAVFPFIEIRKNLDLEATARFIQEQNAWVEGVKRARRDVASETGECDIWGQATVPDLYGLAGQQPRSSSPVI